MDEYLCLTLLSRPGESEGEFKSRLSAFWTRMLRERPADFEKVYAEAVAFERQTDRLSRKYLVEAGVIGVLEPELLRLPAPLQEEDQRPVRPQLPRLDRKSVV